MTTLKRNAADVGLIAMVFVWGFHYIVMKDALANLDPLVFNAIRFSAGLPLLAVFVWFNRELLHVTRRELVIVALLGLSGSTLYQALFVSGLDHTTTTNSSILIATMPAWTAIISIIIGQVWINRRLVGGLAITLLGIVMVILGKAGAELSLSREDLLGGALTLSAAIVLAIHNILKKPLLDRMGAMKIAVWTYVVNVVGLTVIALPQLVDLTADDLPLRALPNVLYSGWLSGIGGFLLMNYGIRVIGPTRASSYFNFPPIIAALAGITLLGEPLTVPLLVGGILTLVGVMLVRRNVYLRPAEEGNTWLQRAGTRVQQAWQRSESR